MALLLCLSVICWREGTHLAGVSALVLWPVGGRNSVSVTLALILHHPSLSSISEAFRRWGVGGSKETAWGSQGRARNYLCRATVLLGTPPPKSLPGPCPIPSLCFLVLEIPRIPYPVYALHSATFLLAPLETASFWVIFYPTGLFVLVHTMLF